MKPCLRVALATVAFSVFGTAHAQQSPDAKATPSSAAAEDPAKQAEAERAAELRELELSEAEFAAKVASLSGGGHFGASRRKSAGD
jgi:hypothetical protein